MLFLKNLRVKMSFKTIIVGLVIIAIVNVVFFTNVFNNNSTKTNLTSNNNNDAIDDNYDAINKKTKNNFDFDNYRFYFKNEIKTRTVDSNTVVEYNNVSILFSECIFDKTEDLADIISINSDEICNNIYDVYLYKFNNINIDKTNAFNLSDDLSALIVSGTFTGEYSNKKFSAIFLPTYNGVRYCVCLENEDIDCYEIMSELIKNTIVLNKRGTL